MPSPKSELELLIQRYPQLKPCEETIEAAFRVLCSSFEVGRKLLIAGNGGSASDADHIAGELLKSFKGNRSLNLEGRSHATLHGKSLDKILSMHLQHALPVIPLSNLTGAITAFCNDCEPTWAFAQLVYGLGQEGDVLWALSTSGNSQNIMNALKVARAKGLKTLGLSGASGGTMRTLCDVCICVPETETYKIQELHLPIYHCLCLMLEKHFWGT